MNAVRVFELTTLSDSQFHAVGAATEKARLPIIVRVRETTSLGAVPERSERTGTRVESGTSEFGIIRF